MNGQNQYGQRPMQGQQQFGQGPSGPVEGQAVDYGAEFNKLGKGGAFLKFEDNVGVELVIMSEGVFKEDAFDDPKTGERKLITKMSFQVHAKDKNGVYNEKDLVTWDIPTGISEKSLYGKVIYLIQKVNNGKATGLRLHIAKDVSGKKPEYKVLEYEQLKSQEMFATGQAQPAAPAQAAAPQARPATPNQPLPPEAFR